MSVFKTLSLCSLAKDRLRRQRWLIQKIGIEPPIPPLCAVGYVRVLWKCDSYVKQWSAGSALVVTSMTGQCNISLNYHGVLLRGAPVICGNSLTSMSLAMYCRTQPASRLCGLPSPDPPENRVILWGLCIDGCTGTRLCLHPRPSSYTGWAKTPDHF